MGEQIEKSSLYDHHRHRQVKGWNLYYCKECVRSYDSKSSKCKFCGSEMRLLDEGTKKRLYYCRACNKHFESFSRKVRCECGAQLAEIKKWSMLKPREKVEIASGRIAKRARSLKKKKK